MYYDMKCKLIEITGRSISKGDIVLFSLRPVNINSLQASQEVYAPIAIIDEDGLFYKSPYGFGKICVVTCLDSIEKIYVYKLEPTDLVQHYICNGCVYNACAPREKLKRTFFGSYELSEVFLRDVKSGDLVLRSLNNKGLANCEYAIVVGEKDTFNGYTVKYGDNFYLIENPSEKEKEIKHCLEEQYMQIQHGQIALCSKEMKPGDLFTNGYLAYLYLGKNPPYCDNMYLTVYLTEKKSCEFIKKLINGNMNKEEFYSCISEIDLEKCFNDFMWLEEERLVFKHCELPIKANYDLLDFFSEVYKRVNAKFTKANIDDYANNKMLEEYFLMKKNLIIMQSEFELMKAVDKYMKDLNAGISADVAKKKYVSKKRSLKRRREKDVRKVSEECYNCCLEYACYR